MAVFSYTGVDRNAATVHGTLVADTPRQARDQLRGDGVRVRRLAETSQRSQRNYLPQWTVRSVSTHWATAVQEMAMMLHAGIPLLDAVETGNHRRGCHNTENAIAGIAQVGISFMQNWRLTEINFGAKHIASQIGLGNVFGAKSITSRIRLEMFSVLI